MPPADPLPDALADADADAEADADDPVAQLRLRTSAPSSLSEHAAKTSPNAATATIVMRKDLPMTFLSLVHRGRGSRRG